MWIHRKRAFFGVCQVMEYVLFRKKKFQLKVQNLCSEISTFYLLISEQHDFWVPERNTPAAIKHTLQKTQTQLMNEYWLTLLLLCISALHARTQHNNCNPSNFHHLQEQDGHVKNSSPRPLPQEEMNIPLRCEVDEGTKKESGRLLISMQRQMCIFVLIRKRWEEKKAGNM